MSITSVVTSKGQVTLPAPIRKAFKIGTLSRSVRFELCKDGSAKIYPVADALSLKGCLADITRAYDPDEREKAWAIATRRLVRKKRS
jgi:bifunctional DNA-binding transcriptional regulator/antitoxin component of YhaV-PrlF toxin-antitoxin module